MREGFDREMDSLLRRHARGTAESRLWGDGGGAQGAHLDADELNAFAEGALPAAARVAAASHLADCASCRGVVVGLARVAGAEVKHPEVKQALAATTQAGPSRTPAWKAFFASLFAPRVLRFAVPVLALALVGAVSFVALRSNRGSLEAARGGLSQNASTQSAPSSAAVAPAANADVNVSGSVEKNGNDSSQTPAAVAPPAQAKGGHGAAEAPQPAQAEAPATKEAQPAEDAPAPPPPAPVTVTEAAAAMSKAGPPKPSKTEEDEVARTDSRNESQSRDKSARAAEPTDDLSVNDTTRQRNVAQQQRGLNQVQMPDGGTRNAKRGEEGNASSGYGASPGGGAAKDSDRAATRSETAGRSRPSRDAREAEKKAGEDDSARDGETRAAAGHRFRRKGSAWVDVNYKENMPSTGVRRNTEAFRALVADVPVVGDVARAIGGDVTVVVGGRAYRIH